MIRIYGAFRCCRNYHDPIRRSPIMQACWLTYAHYIICIFTNSSNLGSARVILPYSLVSTTPFLFSRSLYTENNSDFIPSFSRRFLTRLSLLIEISRSIFLSSSDSSDHILLYTYSSRYWSYSGNI